MIVESVRDDLYPTRFHLWVPLNYRAKWPGCTAVSIRFNNLQIVSQLLYTRKLEFSCSVSNSIASALRIAVDDDIAIQVAVIERATNVTLRYKNSDSALLIRRSDILSSYLNGYIGMVGGSLRVQLSDTIYFFDVESMSLEDSSIEIGRIDFQTVVKLEKIDLQNKVLLNPPCFHSETYEVLKYLDQFIDQGANRCTESNLMLHGPPGGGKSCFIDKIMEMRKFTFKSVKCSSIISNGM